MTKPYTVLAEVLDGLQDATDTATFSVTDHVITDGDEYQLRSYELEEIKKLWREGSDALVEFIAPWEAKVAAIRAQFMEILRPLQDAEMLLTTALSAYETQQKPPRQPRTLWSAEVADPRLLVAAVADERTLLRYIQPNQTELNALARKTKSEDLGVPGVVGVQRGKA